MELSGTRIEAELAAIAEDTEPGRTAHIAIRHWGWDGRGGATLEATGREFGGITRERVRQLCARLAQHIAERKVRVPALQGALLLAAGAAPTTAQALARRLVDEGLAAQPFDPAGLLTAAEILGLEQPFLLDTVKDVRVVLPNPPDPSVDTEAELAGIVDTARAQVRRAGGARVPDITGRVAAAQGVWVDDDLVTAMVSAADDFVWLERRSGWFYLPSVAKNAVVARVVKVLSVAGTLDLSSLHAGIRRDERMKEFVMPEYILAELCQRIPRVRVDGDLVRAHEHIDPRRVLETTEQTLVDVLTACGGAAERHELEELCLARGMKTPSFNNRIAYSPIIEDLGGGVYGLRGYRGHSSGGGARGSADAARRPGDARGSRTSPRR